jgi:hypothetical protein
MFSDVIEATIYTAFVFCNEATTADTREALSADDMLVYSDYR